MISQVMAGHLVDIAKADGNFSRVQTFWNTFHCQNKVYTSEGRIYGKYCKNSFCTICTANRKADLINRYYPVISTWPKPGQKTKIEIYAKAFYHIVEAMKGLRLFDRFGFNLPKKTKMPLAARITTDFQIWIYMPEYHDWQHTESEQTLTGYLPEQELCNLLEWYINTAAE